MVIALQHSHMDKQNPEAVEAEPAESSGPGLSPPSWHAALALPCATKDASFAQVTVSSRRRAPPVDPVPLPPPPALYAHRRALQTLQRFGFPASRQLQFAHAYQQNCCYLCHGPMANYLCDLPCPHWLVGRARQAHELAPIFEIHALADVLHFLLLWVRMDDAGRVNPVLFALRRDAHLGLRIRFGTKQCTFWMAESDLAPPVLSLTLENLRPKRETTLDVTVRASDRAVLHAIFIEIDTA